MRWKSERREGERLDGCQRGGKGRRGGGTVIQLSHREAAGGRERKVVVSKSKMVSGVCKTGKSR